MPKESTGSHVALITSEEKCLTNPFSSYLSTFKIRQSTARKHRRSLYEQQSKVSSCHEMQSLDMFSATKALISCWEQAGRARMRLSRSAAQSCCVWEGQRRMGRETSCERGTLFGQPHQLFLHKYFDTLNLFVCLFV